MKDIESVVLVGLGAIGSICAVKLHTYDPHCLRVILDENRMDRYRRDGILFNEKRYDFNYVLPGEQAQKADLVIIATKSGGLKAAVESIAGFVGSETQILPVLNGITSEEIVAERYGWERVLYSFFTGHTSVRRGNEITHDGIATVVFGEAQNEPVSDRVARIGRFFERAHLAYENPPDMQFALWRKFAVNVGLNQASAVLNAPYKVFQRCDKAMQVVQGLMDEVVAVAKGVGIANAAQLTDTVIESMRALPPEAKTSMLQDVEAGRPTEVDLFARVVCQLGEKHGVATPQNALILRLLEAIEQKNALFPPARSGG